MKNLLIILLTGCGMIAIGLGLSNLATTINPGLQSEYENNSLFRPFSDPLMSLYFIAPIISSIILFWFWGYTKSLIKGENFVRRGVYFGLFYWILTLPGMVMTYSSFPVSIGLVLSWTLTGLAQAAFAGIVFSRTKP